MRERNASRQLRGKRASHNAAGTAARASRAGRASGRASQLGDAGHWLAETLLIGAFAVLLVGVAGALVLGSLGYDFGGETQAMKTLQPTVSISPPVSETPTAKARTAEDGGDKAGKRKGDTKGSVYSSLPNLCKLVKPKTVKRLVGKNPKRNQKKGTFAEKKWMKVGNCTWKSKRGASRRLEVEFTLYHPSNSLNVKRLARRSAKAVKALPDNELVSGLGDEAYRTVRKKVARIFILEQNLHVIVRYKASKPGTNSSLAAGKLMKRDRQAAKDVMRRLPAPGRPAGA